jgi:hypothetical protein
VLGIVHRWYRLPLKARALFVVAALLVCGGVGLLVEGLHFRSTAIRVEGTVIDHDRRGRPIVEYWWAGQRCRHEGQGPSDRLAIGTIVGVYVSPDQPSEVRLDGLVPLLFTPGWLCVMPAIFFTVYGLVVAIQGVRPHAEPNATPDPTHG